MEFKDEIKYVRKRLNLTQIELAKALNIDFSTINKWENGLYQPQLKNKQAFYQFCKSNDIDFNELSELTAKLTDLNLKLSELRAEKENLEGEIKQILNEIITLLKNNKFQ